MFKLLPPSIKCEHLIKTAQRKVSKIKPIIESSSQATFYICHCWGLKGTKGLHRGIKVRVIFNME